MKKYLMFLASAMMLFSVASCNKEKPEQNKPTPQPVEKSKECKLLAFSVKGSAIEITGELYAEDKVVELVCMPEEMALLTDVTATVKISDKATIAPDPATVKDFSKEQKFTITAEDGTTKATWTVKPIAAKLVVEIAKVWDKNLSDLGIENFTKFAGNQVAFCAADKFATAGKHVYGLDGAKVGDLNVTGLVADATIVNLGNDNKGRLVATVGFKDEAYTTPCANAQEIKSTRVYLWKDGWDKAPVQIYENASDVAMFMNVGGDWDNSMIVMAPAPARNCNVHTWVFENGVLKGDKWEFFKTGFSSEAETVAPVLQGAGAGENICPMDGTKEGTFVWAHALPKITVAEGGWDRCGGSEIAVREGISSSENKHVRGTIWADKIAAKQQHGGIWEFGNIEICSSIKGFSFNGEDYVAVSHVGWDKAYFTVVNISKSTEAQTEYLLRTQFKAMAGPMPSVAYVYDAAKDTGHIIVSYGIGTDTNAIPFMMQYDITRKRI